MNTKIHRRGFMAWLGAVLGLTAVGELKATPERRGATSGTPIVPMKNPCCDIRVHESRAVYSPVHTISGNFVLDAYDADKTLLYSLLGRDMQLWCRQGYQQLYDELPSKKYKQYCRPEYGFSMWHLIGPVQYLSRLMDVCQIPRYVTINNRPGFDDLFVLHNPIMTSCQASVTTSVSLAEPEDKLTIFDNSEFIATGVTKNGTELFKTHAVGELVPWDEPDKE